MSLERIEAVAKRIRQRLPSVRGKGEESTKQALVLPMIEALGFDIFHPDEVCPEYEADFAIKKNGQKEKVDFAIIIDGVPRIFVEVKSVDVTLDGHEGQLARYFNSAPTVALAILTNGVEYRFFTDTGGPNIMDSVPFHVVKLDALDPAIGEMARFAKQVFAAEPIRDFATELIYTSKFASFLRNELDLRDREPSEDLIRWILSSSELYDGKVTASVVERFKPIAKNGLQRVLIEVIRRSIAAMDKEVSNGEAQQQGDKPIDNSSNYREPSSDSIEKSSLDSESKNKIITTEEELYCFALVKEIFVTSPFAKASIWDNTYKTELPIELNYRDTTAYFSIYFNKPSNWVARIMTESKTPWIGFNVKSEIGEPLMPPGFERLPSHQFAEFRMSLKTPEDLRLMQKLFFASFQQIIDNRRPRENGVIITSDKFQKVAS